jgi:hypothetical protein
MNIRSFQPSRLASLILVAAFGGTMAAQADQYAFAFSGGGITGTGTLTVAATATPGTDAITGITGSFSDANVPFAGAITGLEPVGPPSSPPPFVPPGLSAAGFSYDNLFYPAGDSPAVCTGYPFFGGVLDCYGLLFDVAGGYTVDVWSNGVLPGSGAPNYNVADALGANFVDYPDPSNGGGVTVSFISFATPEPSPLLFLGTGVLGLVVFKKRKPRA